MTRTEVALMTSRKAGKTQALINALLEQANEQGITVTIHQPLPDRDQIAEIICTETGCQGGSHCARDYEIADAVLALIEGENQ